MYARVCKLIFIISLLQLAAQEQLITNYSAHEGLPTQKIYDCTQDTLGFMWFAAEGGLIKYDGFKWEYFNSLDTASNIIDFTFLFSHQ
jgi:ligand-binding sensor domain-containing protein